MVDTPEEAGEWGVGARGGVSLVLFEYHTLWTIHDSRAARAKEKFSVARGKASGQWKAQVARGKGARSCKEVAEVEEAGGSGGHAKNETA